MDVLPGSESRQPINSERYRSSRRKSRSRCLELSVHLLLRLQDAPGHGDVVGPAKLTLWNRCTVSPILDETNRPLQTHSTARGSRNLRSFAQAILVPRSERAGLREAREALPNSSCYHRKGAGQATSSGIRLIRARKRGKILLNKRLERGLLVPGRACMKPSWAAGQDFGRPELDGRIPSRNWKCLTLQTLSLTFSLRCQQLRLV